MKGDKKLLIIAVLLLLISVSFTTYAIYRETAHAEGTIKTANWVVKLDKGVSATHPISTETITFTGNDLDCGSTRYGKNNTVAPGDSCQLKFTVDARGSEVDVVVEAALGASASVPTGITVGSPAYYDGTTASDGHIAYATSGMTKTVVVNITWQGASTDNTTKDTNDLSIKASNIVIPIDITVRQDIA